MPIALSTLCKTLSLHAEFACVQDLKTVVHAAGKHRGSCQQLPFASIAHAFSSLRTWSDLLGPRGSKSFEGDRACAGGFPWELCRPLTTARRRAISAFLLSTWQRRLALSCSRLRILRDSSSSSSCFRTLHVYYIALHTLYTEASSQACMDVALHEETAQNYDHCCLRPCTCAWWPLLQPIPNAVVAHVCMHRSVDTNALSHSRLRHLLSLTPPAISEAMNHVSDVSGQTTLAHSPDVASRCPPHSSPCDGLICVTCHLHEAHIHGCRGYERFGLSKPLQPALLNQHLVGHRHRVEAHLDAAAVLRFLIRRLCLRRSSTSLIASRSGKGSLRLPLFLGKPSSLQTQGQVHSPHGAEVNFATLGCTESP